MAKRGPFCFPNVPDGTSGRGGDIISEKERGVLALRAILDR